MEIVKRGIPARMLVVGKPCLPNDASNTGYMEKGPLAAAIKKAYDSLGFYTGVAYWQYISDASGESINTVAGYIKKKCATDLKCV